MLNSTFVEQKRCDLPPINSSTYQQGWLKVKNITKIGGEKTINRLPIVEELPKPLPVTIKRDSVRLNSVFLPPIEKRDSIIRRPSFFSTYLKYRQLRKNTLLGSQSSRLSNKIDIKANEAISKDRAESIINSILKSEIETSLRKIHYSSNELNLIKSKLKVIAKLIKDEIKMYCGRNYRIIVDTTVGELKNQGLIVASKCLWDEKKDFCINLKFIHSNFFILVNVFIIYRD
jgi:hypothetical protein